MTGDLV
jgi:hypothetical protein